MSHRAAADAASPFPPDIAFALLPPGGAEPPLLPEERSLLSARALPERRGEFARGRACAREAMARLGFVDAPRQPILRAGARAPRWPEGLVGAISHSHGWAAAAVSWRRLYTGVGLDVERPHAAKPSLVDRIGLPEEAGWLDSVPPAGRPRAFALLFSAKESIYKALNPASGVFLGYHDARVAFPQDVADATAKAPESAQPVESALPIASGRFQWHLLRDSGPAFPSGYRGDGGYVLFAERVITGVWVRA